MIKVAEHWVSINNPQLSFTSLMSQLALYCLGPAGCLTLWVLSEYVMNYPDSIPWPVTWYRPLPGIAHSGRYIRMMGLEPQVAHPKVNLCVQVGATIDYHPS